MAEENICFVMEPAFPPPATPTISSKAKSTLDFAMCRDSYKLIIDKNQGRVRGEIFSGTTILNPSLIIGARRGIVIPDKKPLYVAESGGLGDVIEQLSRYYSSFKGDSFVGVRLENKATLSRFLLNQEGARMLMSPCLTYNYLSAPIGTNEVWVGGDVECYNRACCGAIAPNLEDFFNREATPFLRDL